MVARVPLCDRRQLQLAIADRLPAVESEVLSDHLQSCAHCRKELEQLAGGDEWWNDARTFLSSSDELVAVEDVLKVRGTGETPAPREDDEPPSLHFLAPSDQPGMLGRLGSYEIESVIGRGGMGLVLKAQDPALDRRVAIKVLAGHLATSAAARRRFAYEAKAAAAVVHDHVIPIHVVEPNGQTPFLVMPLIAGRSLQDRLDEQGPLETREVLRIAMQTAEGLAAAHAQGLVHRDIKPANILLENGCERVRITDFGLARAVDDASMTQSGYIAGTPQYMAPEQARGEPIDARADLFSLGSVIYAMCTGRPPFRAETTLAVLRRICDDQARDVREINPDVPLWLSEIITRLLAKSPAERFQSASEVAELLKQWLAHLAQPTLILPPKFVSLPTPTKPAAATWRTWLAPLGIVGTVVAAGAVSFWLSGVLDRRAGGVSLPIVSPAVPAQAYRPANTGRSPGIVNSAVEIPPGRRDLLGAHFAADLAAADQATAWLEAQAASVASPGPSPGQELADLATRVQQLESELAALLTPERSPTPVLEPNVTPPIER